MRTLTWSEYPSAVMDVNSSSSFVKELTDTGSEKYLEVL